MLSSRKQPRNQLENPVQPYIPAALPRFYNSGKSWKVDVGQTIKETKEKMLGSGSKVDVNNGSILAVSRYNQAPYGASSHRAKWDGSMRLALLNPYEKYYPTNRIPVKARKSIRVRNNMKTTTPVTQIHNEGGYRYSIGSTSGNFLSYK